jgi:C1A family cysteine protease
MQRLIRGAWLLGAVSATVLLLCGCSYRQERRFADEREQTADRGEKEKVTLPSGEADKDFLNKQEERSRLPLIAKEVSEAIRRRNQWMRQEEKRRILEEDIVLPVRCDAREAGRTAPVEDQKDLGTCWAFSSLTAVENALLPQEVWDFSEDHMSHNPHFILGQENGGEYTMSMAYLLSWQGPVTEEQDPYGDGISPEGLKPVKHVQEVRVLPENDREMIKRAVLACGGVQSSLYTTLQNSRSQSKYYNPETSAYCYPHSTAPNHDVVIVGWDDDFPAEAFRTEVEGNGAFLCENSWGTEFGDGGFFYVSYYDANLGKTNIVYTSIEEPDNYDFLYQGDLCGWIGQLGYGEEAAWAANVYTAGQAEEVAAAGFYAIDENTDYQVYVVRHVPEDPTGVLQQRTEPLAEGKLRQAGYYTIPLRKTVFVDAGERFAVVIHLKTPGAIHPIAVEYDAGDGKCQIDLSDGEGYISFEGQRWENVEEKQNCNICLKAYTRIRQEDQTEQGATAGEEKAKTG